MSGQSVWLLGGALCLFGSGAGAVPSLTTLYTFHGPDGAVPAEPLAMDQDGNLYGTTVAGGPGNTGRSFVGKGTVFELSGYNHYRFRTLWAFDSTNYYPSTSAPLFFDANGDLYGATSYGGSSGFGTVYKLTGSRHSDFVEVADIGAVDGLSLDFTRTVFQTGAPYRTGDLIGVSSVGGSNNIGDIFELSGSDYSTSTTLYSASGAVSPFRGHGALVADLFGNLYGTTGGLGAGDGSVFELSGPHFETYTTLATFNSATTGSVPTGSLTFDRHGDLYGVTEAGGPNGGGTIFKLSGGDHRQLTCLYSFGDNGGPDGTGPNGPLIIDAAGNLFGTASSGGIDGGRAGTFGLIFRLSHDHKTYTVPYRFTGGGDGSGPQAGLIVDLAGNLYGTTSSGGSDYGVGTVFKLSNVGFRRW